MLQARFNLAIEARCRTPSRRVGKSRCSSNNSLNAEGRFAARLNLRRLTQLPRERVCALRFDVSRIGMPRCSRVCAGSHCPINPLPMGLTLEEELSRPSRVFGISCLSPLPNAVFGAFISGELVATAAVSRPSVLASSSHKMLMWGVFTSPRFRRRGIGRLVVEHAIHHALESGALRVNLLAYVPNEAALALYRGLGFVKCGTEPEAVNLDGQYFDGVHMSLRRDAFRARTIGEGARGRSP